MDTPGEQMNVDPDQHQGASTSQATVGTKKKNLGSAQRKATAADFKIGSGKTLVDPYSMKPIGDDINEEGYGNVVQKNVVMVFIVICCKMICIKYFSCFKRDVRISNDSASIFRTCHNYLRKHNGVMGTNAEENKKQGITTENKIVTCGLVFNINMVKVCEDLILIASHLDLDYKADKKAKGNWFATAAPLICYLTTFKNRVDELRLGTNEFNVKKVKDGKDQRSTLTQFGFNYYHSALASCISYPPELRSSMIKATGPVTQLIGLLSNPTKPYCTKYVNALSETFKFINGNEAIWNALLNRPNTAAAKSICRNLADIALIATARHHVKASIPVVMLFDMLPPALEKHYFRKSELTSWVLPNTACVEPIIDTHHMFSIDFSGKGLFYFIKSYKHQLLMPQMDVAKAQQIIFHGIFGTQFEEFSILTEMTGVNKWFSRNELGTIFQGMGQKEEVVSVPLIAPIYGSRMRKAVQTKMSRQIAPQLVSTSVFSGHQVHPLLKLFIDVLENETSQSLGSLTDIDEINKSLASLRSSLIDEIRMKKEIAYGTARWFTVGNWPPPVNDDEVPYIDKVFVGKNVYFNALSSTQIDAYEIKEDENKAAKKKRLESIK